MQSRMGATWLAFLDRVCFFITICMLEIMPSPCSAFEINLIVISLTACYLACTRSVGVAYFAAGAVLCSLTVKTLKRILRQPRPVPHSSSSRLELTYGFAKYV